MGNLNLRSVLIILLVILASCNDKPKAVGNRATELSKDTLVEESNNTKTFTGKKVPVLCYHAIREIKSTDSGEQKAYSVSPENFAAQMKVLSENGYTSITPNQLHDFYTARKSLPEKPVMVTFDDGRKEQHDIGAKILEENGLRGTFFIMTVSLGRSVYMSKNDVKDLSDRGHTIGCHTWDHHMVTKYQGEDFHLQLKKPKMQLEKITGKPVTSFAYPYGLWNKTAADSLQKMGYKTAFIFYGKQDQSLPLYTIERINIPSSMKIADFETKLEKFHVE